MNGARILIAGGGTGGHLFPGIALAEEFSGRGQGHRVRFVGTARGLEVRHVPRAGFELELIEVGALKGRGLLGWLRGLMRLPRALWQSRRILRAFRPDVVVGVGGYASGPVVLMAWLGRVPCVVLEQNALAGFTNRILGRLVRRAVVAFPEAEACFPRGKAILLGNPVRRALVENFLLSREPHEQPRMLVFGGSQGARALNRLVPEAVARLRQRLPGLEVTHQTGEAERDSVAARYAELGLEGGVEVLGFIEDMAAAYRRADLVICRAGATSVAELSLCRAPAILIPFPHAADNHQEKNARALVEAGAALMLREAALGPAELAELAGGLLAEPERLAAMQAAAGRVSRPESAREIADLVLDLAALRRKNASAGEGR
jgi:UDP-N-acetylglucosamine--N-acetylmuramyl-(pentapeptide) pyrophosphoryl-undecaprenol N-acetylglucosamine transferase